MMRVWLWPTCSVKEQDFSKHIFWYLCLPRYKNLREELQPLFKIRNNSNNNAPHTPPQTSNPAMKATSCCIPYCTYVTYLKMTAHSSFDLFRNSWGGEKRKTEKKLPFCGVSCRSSGISTEWSLGINWFFKRHSCHYEWSSNSEGRVASQTR